MKVVCAPLFAGIVACAFAPSGLAAEAAKASAKAIHSFGSGTDGQIPYANLTAAQGTLYGTTELGGAAGYGAAFSVDPKTGAETVLYSFCSQQSCSDGRDPEGGLVDVSGTLYGTTHVGGTYDGGTIFALDPSTGAETVLVSFCVRAGSCADGEYPTGSMINVNGTLYGTTYWGGSHFYGTVFAIDLSTGKEASIHSFCSQSNCADGMFPEASLTDVAGTLYGTTYYGGASGDGTVFAIDLSTNTETVIHSFGGNPDGSNPAAGLVDMKGTLYGTTTTGGAHAGGTVFAVDPSTGTETVLYSFCAQQNCADGSSPAASLINVKGTLYGTTFWGGSSGNGTVFAFDPSTGTQTTLYSFCSPKGKCASGANPGASLISLKGMLYGTAEYGGADCKGSGGCGTVFALKP